jgi:hypothetical protein
MQPRLPAVETTQWIIALGSIGSALIGSRSGSRTGSSAREFDVNCSLSSLGLSEIVRRNSRPRQGSELRTCLRSLK